MHQISFSAFAQQMVCAPSATQTVEAQAVAAPASSGSGACSLREIRRKRCCAAVMNRMLDGRLSGWDRWVWVVHGSGGPVIGRAMLRPEGGISYPGVVQSVHRIQVAA